jgi:hypothetical protein
VPTTADIALHESGIVVTRVRAGARQSLGDARDNLDAAIAVAGGRRRPLLVDISRCEPLAPEVRHFYSGQRLVDAFSALALLIEASPFGRMMGNIYLRVARLGVPTRLFTDEDAAFEWLRGFRA